MLDIERILRQDRLMRAMTGLNRQAFEALLPSFAVAYRESLFQSPQPRQRGLGGGRKARLDSIESKLVYILVYCKCYPTFDLAGVLFGFDRSQAHEWTHRLMPILETALGHEMVLPERQVNSVEAFMPRNVRYNDRKTRNGRKRTILARRNVIPANTWQQWMSRNGS
jgi:hypothetical protein